MQLLDERHQPPRTLSEPAPVGPIYLLIYLLIYLMIYLTIDL